MNAGMTSVLSMLDVGCQCGMLNLGHLIPSRFVPEALRETDPYFSTPLRAGNRGLRVARM